MLANKLNNISCFRYHKGTDFQANHNRLAKILSELSVVLDTTKVQIFKQITTSVRLLAIGSYVVLDTTKVQIFKQITTQNEMKMKEHLLF